MIARAVNVVRAPTGAALKIVDCVPDRPRAGEIRVRVAAAALNYRDLALMRGLSFGDAADRYVPLSDSCGYVEDVGDEVTAWSVGDRVCSLFFPDWLAGQALSTQRFALGSSLRGVAQQFFTADANAVIAAPPSLTDVEAATLPCAGLTAWNAIAYTGHAIPGATVLIQGTGGVSLFALQFAVAFGLRVIVTSSSDAKIQRAIAMGASAGINYRDNPEWAAAARELTGGNGVDLVVEVGGAGTFSQSLQAIRLGGAIAVVGMLTGGTENIDLRAIYGNNANIRGITVGSKEMFAEMNRAIAAHSIRPVIDTVFDWTEIEDAFELMAAGKAFGKIVLDFEGPQSGKANV